MTPPADRPDRPGRPQLSKAAVVERALKLADTDGLDALTIRKLAQDLGVTAMALYWHFRSKDELLEALGERIWSEIDLNVDLAAPWPEQLRKLLVSLVSVLRAHPCAPRLLSAHEGTNEYSLRATEIALTILRERAGFDVKTASEITRLGLWTAITLVLSEVGFDPGRSMDERCEKQRTKMIGFAMLPPSQYPQLVACASALTSLDDIEYHYRTGVDLYIGGVIALAAASGDQPAPGTTSPDS
jgi:TetR/AcrR family transcriptional regulator, tetracycline repressor protein